MTTKKDNRVMLGLMLPEALANKVSKAAKKMGVSKSGYVRYILIKEFDRNENRFQNVEAGESSPISFRFVDQDS